MLTILILWTKVADMEIKDRNNLFVPLNNFNSQQKLGSEKMERGIKKKNYK